MIFKWIFLLPKIIFWLAFALILLWFLRIINKNKPEPKFIGLRNIDRYLQPLSNYASHATSGAKDSKGEIMCRQILEEIYGLPFAKQKIFKNPVTGRLLELDGYNARLRLAIEYNGKHHYNNLDQERRDIIKRQECDKRNIYLIPVPYRIPFGQIKKHIASLLPPSIDHFIVDQKTLDYVREVRQPHLKNKDESVHARVKTGISAESEIWGNVVSI